MLLIQQTGLVTEKKKRKKRGRYERNNHELRSECLCVINLLVIQVNIHVFGSLVWAALLAR